MLLRDSASSWIVALLLLEQLPPDAPAPGASSRVLVYQRCYAPDAAQDRSHMRYSRRFETQDGITVQCKLEHLSCQS
jgi:hypothetical protein